MRRILLTGKRGQVGFELQRSLSTIGEVTAVGREECDLQETEQVERLLDHICPNIIINAAAYTNVDLAERETQAAKTINTKVPALISSWAKIHDALVVHYSTDYVFSGENAGRYTEEDPAVPKSFYGRTKLAGEEAIRNSGCHYFIFRTSWAYGAYGNNFLKTIINLAKKQSSLKVVSDQYGTPTAAHLIADITAHVLTNYQIKNNIFGTYNLAPTGETSWYDYARYIIRTARELGMSLSLHENDIIPIPSTEYKAIAIRPKNSKLNTHKLRTTFELNLPAWQDDVSHVLTQLSNL